MNYAGGASALRDYQKMRTEQEVAGANPHQLIQLMLERLLAKIAIARGHLERGDSAGKGTHIGAAISIVDGLRVSLDTDRGGQLAANLSGLYEYMSRRLLHAQLRDDTSALDEVATLVREIKSAWEAIADRAAGHFTDDPSEDKTGAIEGNVTRGTGK